MTNRIGRSKFKRVNISCNEAILGHSQSVFEQRSIKTSRIGVANHLIESTINLPTVHKESIGDYLRPACKLWRVELQSDLR